MQQQNQTYFWNHHLVKDIYQICFPNPKQEKYLSNNERPILKEDDIDSSSNDASSDHSSSDYASSDHA